jgi:predicted dehydrogenase
MRDGTVGVGIIGAGVISEQYLANLTTFPDLDVRFVADLDAARAAQQAARFGVPRSGSVRELLDDDDVELVVNLTVPAAHVEIGLDVLSSGRHVFAEKPLALDPADGRRLLERATELGLRVASAPDTFLGGGLQTAQRLVEDGVIGTPLTALALFQGTGPEAWHPNPDFLFAPGGGPLFDMGPYYLTALVQLLGPVVGVQAVSSTAHSTRTIATGTRAGESIPVRVPTYHAAMLEFGGGAVAQAVFSFQSPRRHDPVIEIAGTGGAMALSDPNRFDGSTRVWSDDPVNAIEVAAGSTVHGRGLGVVELARAIRSGAPERASGALAFHVLDVMTAIAEAAAGRRRIELVSEFERPALLPDAWDPTASTLAADLPV